MSTGGNERNTRTIHPKQSARREGVLRRIQPETLRGNSNEQVIRTLAMRINKPPRSWSRA